MKRTTTTSLTAIAAVAILATALGTASARNVSISNQNIRSVFRPLLFSNGGVTLECTVTLEGSFHYRTIVKSLGALFGYVTSAAFQEERCGGSILFQGNRVRGEGLPWHITYQGFRGRLPEIERVILQLRGFLFTISNLFIGQCIYAGTMQVFALPATQELDTDSTFGISRTVRSSGSCPSPVFPNGLTRLTLLGTTTLVSVTLI